MYVEPWMFFLLLGSFGVHLWLSAPVSAEDRAWKRDRQQARQESWAISKAERAARKAHNHAWRRRVFGSHPVLYGALFWLSAPVLLSLCAALMGR